MPEQGSTTHPCLMALMLGLRLACDASRISRKQKYLADCCAGAHSANSANAKRPSSQGAAQAALACHACQYASTPVASQRPGEPSCCCALGASQDVSYARIEQLSCRQRRHLRQSAACPSAGGCRCAAAMAPARFRHCLAVLIRCSASNGRREARASAGTRRRAPRTPRAPREGAGAQGQRGEPAELRSRDRGASIDGRRPLSERTGARREGAHSC